MRIIDLNAENWKSILDFYDALLPALGAPAWHGHSVNAIIDSMIWGGINAVEPPYTVRISGLNKTPQDVAEKVTYVKGAIAKARAEFNHRKGHDIDVSMETAS